MSSTIYGGQLTTPVTQSILPVIIKTGKVLGFLTLSTPVTYAANAAIPSATINGQVVQPSVVTLPAKGSNSIDDYRISQYVAYVVPQSQESSLPCTGMAAFIPAGQDGNYSGWSAPASSGAVLRANNGTLLQALKLNITTAYNPPVASGNPIANNASMNWTCQAFTSGFANPNSFFDFNWMAAFGTPISGSNPVRISTVSNPAGNIFKAMLVTSAGQSVAPAGAVIFNTIRILALAPAPAGAYVFTFAVTDSLNNSTNVTLTLNVVD